MSAGRRTESAVAVAATAAACMIAYQVAAKATREALFLSNFDVAALPAMVIASATLSLVLAVLAARVMGAVGPARLVPAVFAGSGLLLLGEWALVEAFGRPIAVVFYLHYTGIGALLVSGVWSIVNERFDPRTARRQIGRIGAGATVGGLVGGVLAWQVGATLSVAAMLPILAVVHLGCGWLVFRLGAGVERTRSRAERGLPGHTTASGFRLLIGTPYLRTLLWLVMLATVSEGLLDYVFKAEADARFGGGEDLLRLFAAFYTGIALIAVVIQSAATRPALQRLGLARSAAVLPSAVVIGGTGALLVPGLTSIALARGLDAVLRTSVYRSAYELLFAPVAQHDKRATKAIVDVGAVRVGDIAGGGIVQATLVAASQAANAVLLALAVAVAAVTLVVSRRLHRGYVRTLERSLLSRAGQLDLSAVDDAMTRTALLQTVGTLGLGSEIERVPAPLSIPGEERAAVQAPPAAAAVPDAEVRRVLDVRSGDAARVRRGLHDGPLSRSLVAHVVPLLAWDQVAEDAIRALRPIAGQVAGQLIDHLLDPDEEFTVRRRLPLVLVASPSERVVDGLLRGLEDRRFEVRYRCGRALSRLLELAPGLRVERERALAAVLREVAVDRGVWESQRLLDRMEDEAWSPVVDEVLRERANRSLEHVFTVLSLVLPRQPLKVAFRGLHTSDALLRGTALEYLETALPGQIREKLWPFLEDTGDAPLVRRSTQEVLDDLLKSRESIATNLEALRRRASSSEP